MGVRRKGRELALKLLYRIYLTGESWDGVKEVLDEYGGNDAVRDFACELVGAVLDHLHEIDAIIVDSAKNWDLARMPTLDRNMIRIAAAEHLVLGSASPAVIIDEAVEIAGRYSTDRSGAFVNGVLDRIISTRAERSLPPDGHDAS